MAELLNRASLSARATAAGIGAAPKRQGAGVLTAVTLGATLAAGFLLSFAPPLAAIVSHAVDRISNHIKKNRELDARADWYRNEVAAVLHMDPAKVRRRHLLKAAEDHNNPLLKAAVKDALQLEAKDNKSSAMINTAVAFIPGGTVLKEVGGVAVAATKGAKAMAGAAHLGKTLAVTTGAGLLADWTTKENLSAQEIIEGISQQQEAGQPITPQIVFLLRLAQDESLLKKIHDEYKKPFQMMSLEEQAKVMERIDYKVLANSATMDADDLMAGKPVQKLMTEIDLSDTAKYRVGTKRASFVEVEMNRRAGVTTNVGAGREAAANDGSFVGRETARRATAAQAVNAV